MEHLLIEAGAIAADDPRPAARKAFTAAPYTALIAEIPTLIGSMTLRRAMGAHQNSFEAVVADGVWRHAPQACRRPGGCGTASIWWSRFMRARPAARMGRSGGRTLQRARARSGLGLNEILRAIRDGRLQVWRKAGSDGWRSFRVRKAQIDRMARPRDRMAHLLP
jgi:hypothetical protein